MRIAKLMMLGACLALGACGHNVYLTGRSNGLQGTTVVKGGSGGGDMNITLGPRVYSGRWIYAAEGGGTSFGTATSFSGGQAATTNATFVALPTGGNGTVIASAPDGTQLRCVFNYSELSDAGSGVCQDSTGQIFDMQIH
jgi:hypothetical protein